MALFSECTVNYALKLLDAADIVREAIFQQLYVRVFIEHLRLGTRKHTINNLYEGGPQFA